MAPPRVKKTAGGKVRYGGAGSGGEIIPGTGQRAPEDVKDYSPTWGVADVIQWLMPGERKPIFVDVKALKDKLRTNMHKPRYDVTNFYHEQGCFQSVARSGWFEQVTLAVISFNALWIAIDMDLNTAEVAHEADPVFIIADNSFCTFFVVELTVRFGAFKAKCNCLKDMWFVFDTCLVAMMIAETWVMTFVLLALGISSGSGLGNAGALRLIRLMRLARMARLARLLRSMPELLILIKGMIASARSVSFTVLLLLLILYVFAILFRQLTDGTAIGEEYFPSLTASANLLVICGVLFDNALEVQTRFVTDDAQHLLLCYFLFVLLATLTVMNMLIGVLCEVIFTTAEVEHETLTVCDVQDHLLEIVDIVCKNYDDDGQIKIDKVDFLNIMQHPSAAYLLSQVRVDVLAMVDLIDTIFDCERGHERVLTFPELTEVMLNQRTTEGATVRDINDMRKYFHVRLEMKEKEYNARFFALGSTLEQALGLPAGEYAKEVKAAFYDLRKEREAEIEASRSLRQTLRRSIAKCKDKPGSAAARIHNALNANSNLNTAAQSPVAEECSDRSMEKKKVVINAPEPEPVPKPAQKFPAASPVASSPRPEAQLLGGDPALSADTPPELEAAQTESAAGTLNILEQGDLDVDSPDRPSTPESTFVKSKFKKKLADRRSRKCESQDLPGSQESLVPPSPEIEESPGSSKDLRVASPQIGSQFVNMQPVDSVGNSSGNIQNDEISPSEREVQMQSGVWESPSRPKRTFKAKREQKSASKLAVDE